MGRIDGQIAPPPPGAGRFRDVVYPDPGRLTSTDGLNGQYGFRLAGNLVSVNTPLPESFNFGGGGTNAGYSQNGIDCSLVQCLSVIPNQGTGVRLVDAMNLHIKTSRNFLTPLSDDEHCFRVFANLAVQPGQIPAAGTDFGFYIINPVNNGRILADSSTGWGFNFINGSQVQFLVRGPNGLKSTLLTNAPFDTTQFHTYECRIVGATVNTDATLQVLIDGIPVTVLPVTQQSWAAGSDLPPTREYGNRIGFCPFLVNCGQNTSLSLCVQKVRFISGPTLESLF